MTKACFPILGIKPQLCTCRVGSGGFSQQFEPDLKTRRVLTHLVPVCKAAFCHRKTVVRAVSRELMDPARSFSSPWASWVRTTSPPCFLKTTEKGSVQPLTQTPGEQALRWEGGGLTRTRSFSFHLISWKKWLVRVYMVQS